MAVHEQVIYIPLFSLMLVVPVVSLHSGHLLMSMSLVVFPTGALAPKEIHTLNKLYVNVFYGTLAVSGE